jgi:two-component system LytT family response regulator
VEQEMKIRALIIEDEPVARKRMKRLLADDSEIEVIGECVDGREAVAAIQKFKPDLIFLDIQIPELDGFDVLKAIEIEQMPFVIFVTAFNKYAIKAFEFHALDYLLKPFEPERLQSSLDRVKKQIRQENTGDLETRLRSLLEDVKPTPSGYQERLAIKSDEEVMFLKIEEIDWIEPAGNFLRLHIGKESHLIRETLSALEAKLDPRKFMRIQRSAIVNIARIKKLHPLFRGEYVVVLQNGVRLTSTQGYRDKLRELIEGKI